MCIHRVHDMILIIDLIGVYKRLAIYQVRIKGIHTYTDWVGSTFPVNNEYTFLVSIYNSRNAAMT